MKTRALIIFGLLALIVALPLAMRRHTETTSAARADDNLIVLTPHNESIRQEFGEAFAAYWKSTTGRSIHVDWRTPGGTSEIRMVLDAGGRHYLAKDATATPAVIRAGYPRLEEWLAVRRQLDPTGVFVSDQARRLDLL